MMSEQDFHATATSAGASATQLAAAYPADTRAAAHATRAFAAPTSAAHAASEAAAPSWHDTIPDARLRDWAREKGWRDPVAALESHHALERLMGAERTGRTVVLPSENATPEEVQAFRARLGVPDSAEGYALPLPANTPAGFARTAAQWMHEAGVPAQSASLLAQRWNAHLVQQQQAATQAQHAAAQARAAEDAAQLDALKSEWGNQYDANAEHARRAALRFGPGATDAERDAQLQKIERALGPAAYLRFMSGLGKRLGEHALIGSGDAGAPGGTPETARSRIAELKADRAWTAAYVAGDAGKAAEMSRLHRVAFGEETD